MTDKNQVKIPNIINKLITDLSDIEFIDLYENYYDFIKNLKRF